METRLFFSCLIERGVIIRERVLFCSSIMIVIAVSFPVLSFAYTPPIGIPDPGSWGVIHPIDSSAPVMSAECPNWPSAETAGCYYIDNTAGNATDSGNQYGYPGKPRATVPEITYSAGSYVEVHGGPYLDKYMNISFNGTVEKPCWFRGTPGNMPIFPKFVSIKDSSYLVAEYLDFNGGDSFGGLNIAGSSHHIAVRNSQFRNKAYVSNSSGLGIKPDIGDTLHDVVVYKCNFENLGDWNPPDSSDPDYHGITPSLWGRDSTTEEYNIWILENTFYHLSGNGVQVNAGNWPDSYKYLHHIYIGRNTAHALRQAGFWSKQASDVIMSENVVYDNRKHGYQMGDCFGYQYRPNNLWIIYNTCHDVNFGIRQTDDSYGSLDNKSYIIGNYFYNIYPEDLGSYDSDHPWRSGVAISLWTGGMHRYVVDNTIFGCQNGINAIQTGKGSSLNINNNIIANIGADGWPLFIFQNVDQDTNVGKNLFYEPDGSLRISWGGHHYTSLNDFQTATRECQGCLDKDKPLFIDVAGNNYALQENSLVKEWRGKDPVYTTFFNRYGIDISGGQVSGPLPGASKISPPNNFILVH